MAWWPGAASSAQVTSASGVTTQQLTFTPLSAAPAAPANASGNAPSSPCQVARRAALRQDQSPLGDPQPLDAAVQVREPESNRPDRR